MQQWQARSAAMQIMTAVGFEPTQLALVELESTPLDHSGKVSRAPRARRRTVSDQSPPRTAAQLISHRHEVSDQSLRTIQPTYLWNRRFG